MNVPEINEVKEQFEKLKQQGFVATWELPYENILTRRSAAIFFFSPTDDSKTKNIEEELSVYKNFSLRINEEKKLSALKYRVTFADSE